MSHDATSWARAQKTGSMSAKFILMRLADYAGTDFSCYPGIPKLAAECEMGESTVRAATKLLSELGLIRVYYRHRKDGSRRSCRYQLLVDGPETAEPDADDWASYRQISADDNRQDSAGDAPDLSGYARQISAVTPISEPSLKEPSPVVQRASRSERATRVPDDFQPDEKMRAWFVAENLGSVLNGKWEHEKFMDFWRAEAGAKARKLDWAAAWRKWMRTAAERAGRRPVSAPPGTSVMPTSGTQQYSATSTTNKRVLEGLAIAAKYEEMGL